MKLPEANLDVAAMLAEFDVWITPSLGEIRDTQRFDDEMETVVRVFEAMSDATMGFANPATSQPDAIADLFVELSGTLDEEKACELLGGLASVLFLVTGKSDNNAKCQLPLFLRDHGGWSRFPATRKRGGKVSVQNADIPRVLKSDKVMNTVVALADHIDRKRALLREFVQFVLSDEKDVAQLWSIGKSYVMMKEFGKQRDLLTPLVVFQVRGSVSASGGHGPEDILRERFNEWGMIRAVDYNTNDVVVSKQTTSGRRGKTRAYDFVLPHQTPGWEPHVFIQCQFYAGDSGSVSHKNVDQTSTSRSVVSKAFDDPRFVEYVDGAGYFSSLNGDLASLLSMAHTASFFQLRTAPIRLRRALQSIGFLTPLEVAHAALRNPQRADILATLSDEGYKSQEIKRVLAVADDMGYVRFDNDSASIDPNRRDLVRRYFLLDAAACFGQDAQGDKARLTGSLAVPGYGPFYGMKIDELVAKTIDLAPSLETDWSRQQAPLEDIRWLCECGFAMST